MKKSWLLALIVVVSLGVIGVGLAAWTETITIAGSVTTGDINPDFTSASTDDPGTTIDPGTDKNVGMTEVSFSADAATVTVTNAYPGYHSDVTLTVKNNGSVPIEITDYSIDSLPDEISLTSSDSGLVPGTVIGAGESKSGTFTQTVNDGAAESSNYTYGITITAEQWNHASL
ncbi:MAG: hypothetical protein D9V47_09585 [Clostridia bacterium]|nr:MAG: hypothetical protein D9V47_09585 [Clostridia bacterium]